MRLCRHGFLIIFPGSVWQGGDGCSSLKAFRPLLLGIVVVFYLTNRPTNAKWLSKEESDWLEGELSAERKVKLENK